MSFTVTIDPDRRLSKSDQDLVNEEWPSSKFEFYSNAGDYATDALRDNAVDAVRVERVR